MSIHVAVYGLGYIGALIAKAALTKRNVKLVAGIDVDLSKVGKDLGEALNLNRKLGVKVAHDDEAEKILSETKPQIVLHSTLTHLNEVYPQLIKCIKVKANVISTAETLSYPWYRHPKLASLIDEEAKKTGVSILGTGVNPGFIFDSLPAFLTSTCVKVDGIHIIRSINAALRRYSFQKKYGLGMSVEEFKTKALGHTGYAESILLLASIIGVNIDKIKENQEPILAKENLTTEYFNINPGQVCGVKGYGFGYVNGKEFIKLELIAAVNQKDFDEIIIDGEPPLKWRNEYGTSGDIATAAMIVNMIPKVLKAPKGLITMKEFIPSISLI
ncbi:dihydrodipicolinate reductase [Candidatus Bathyarchaeota archaeon]|nr:dihydrodipicolinate reductase [Candidatus Bathyarchaeota archaeon]